MPFADFVKTTVLLSAAAATALAAVTLVAARSANDARTATVGIAWWGVSALIGLAGGYLSVVDVKLWVPGISGGRGWIAIALVIFARWQPWRALIGALLFAAGVGSIYYLAKHIREWK